MERKMSNLRVFDPFAVDTSEDMVRKFFRPMRFDVDFPATSIKVDVEEADKHYVVKADIPGVKKDDIHIDIDGNYVSIEAEVKKEKDVKDNGRLLRSERYYGSVSRAFTLGSDVDAATAKAKYDNGVLELTLPKRASSQAKRVTIQ
jgi:HSP20 family protein